MSMSDSGGSMQRILFHSHRATQPFLKNLRNQFRLIAAGVERFCSLQREPLCPEIE
jgi:hypothetical protein